MVRLKVNNVSKIFTDRPGERQVVLENVNMEVREGEFVALLGPSGCGKTTLLTMIGGFQDCTEGEILLDGQPIQGEVSLLIYRLCFPELCPLPLDDR